MQSESGHTLAHKTITVVTKERPENLYDPYVVLEKKKAVAVGHYHAKSHFAL